ncbi:MAG: hypothetical protein ACKO3O_03875, partial [Gammaproteobacteria bacterium]
MSSRSTTASGLALGILMIGAGTALAAPFTAQDLNTLARVSDPQVSPDGRYVVYTLRETDMEANRGRT